MVKFVHGRKYTLIAPTGQYLVVDIYPVGLMADLRTSWRLKRIRLHLKSQIWNHVRRREWRELKNTFNGYLAEPDVMPGNLTRCGSGWTRSRAFKDLRRRVKKTRM